MQSDADTVEQYLAGLPDDRRPAMGVYGDDSAQVFLREHWPTDKKLDMGKSCVRFRSLDDLPLDLIGQVISRTSVDDLIAADERARAR